MNSTLQIFIALLIAFGILMTQNDWNNLTTEQQTQYQKKIVTDDVINF